MVAFFSRPIAARSASNVIYVIDVESDFKSNPEPIKRDGAFQDFVAALDAATLLITAASISASDEGARSTTSAQAASLGIAFIPSTGLRSSTAWSLSDDKPTSRQ